ncbi:hypothetical protein AX16_004069 [Volvariella volvacea WC 439]|nr:hypothetical protein AX16_004069 [Volvariella volvacea WC 439]
MRHLPPERRRVKFLFISMIQEQSKMAAIKFEYHRRDAFAIEYQELLRLIAPTLEILHACMDYALPFYLIPPQSPLPVLRELTIFDGPKMGAPPHPAQFPDLPRLQHVHLVNPTTQLPKHLAAYPQSIVNLRISATWIQGCLNLMDGMAEKTNPLGAGSTVWLSSPREPERRWREVTGAVRRLTREREWLKLLPERHKYQPAGPVAAREAWLERLTGYTWW